MRPRLLLVAALAGALALAAATVRPAAAATGLPDPIGTVTSTISGLAGAAADATAAAPALPMPATTTSGGWRTTATQALRLNGTKLGPLAGATRLRVSVALRMRNADALRNSIASGARITPAEFASTYGASAADAKAVATYLTGRGFTNVAIEPNRLFVTGTATAAQAESAFDTTLTTWSVRGETLYANSTPARVPATLAAPIAVLGLNDAAKMTIPQRTADDGGVPNYLTSYTPQGFWKAYDATDAPTGAGTAIAIFAEGDMSGVITDLRAEEAANGLPRVPVQVVQVGAPSSDTAGADEWDMDTQFSTGMAGTVKTLYLYATTSLTDADVTLEFSRFATDNLAVAGSASFGECEYQAYLDGSMVAMDQVFNEAAAQGQTVFASSGDTGGFCPVVPDNGVPAGAPDVNYPASSPYVVSVGGTTLLTNADGSYDQEAAWVAGGGGPSLFEYQPSWQAGVAPPTGSTCVEYVACVGKTVPDVAMDADPESGAAVYVGGSPEGVGGTSLSSPLALGVWARLQSAHGNTLGFAAPKLYAAYGSAGYHDVTLGDTGPYPATPGYDLATGVGTFDVARMVGAIVPPVVPPAALPAPACTLVTDAAGDASPIGSTGNVDSLDIRAAGFVPDATNVTAQLLVQSLSDGPGGTTAVAGAGDVWYVVWTSGGTQWFLEAEYPGSTVDPDSPGVPVDYSYGEIDTSPTGGGQYTTLGAATGSLDAAAGTITISAPASAFGLGAGAVLANPSGQTFESVGTPATGGLLEAADTAGPGSAYTLGGGCGTPVSTAAGHGSGGGSHGKPNPGSGGSHGRPGGGTSTSPSGTSGVAAAHASKHRTARAHGTVRVRGSRRTATFSLDFRRGHGHKVVYRDRTHRLRFRSLRILQTRYGTHFVLVKGLGILNGRRVRFTARAIDRGAHGDVFRIAWTHGHARGGTLLHGSVIVS
ncbi:MAG TPA: S53 family peptidase [Gaiellaceae bacterium]|nr:S53 family peptidase [Gaiellaceae bacterium]